MPQIPKNLFQGNIPKNGYSQRFGLEWSSWLSVKGSLLLWGKCVEIGDEKEAWESQKINNITCNKTPDNKPSVESNGNFLNINFCSKEYDRDKPIQISNDGDYVVFISSNAKCVAMLEQKAAQGDQFGKNFCYVKLVISINLTFRFKSIGIIMLYTFHLVLFLTWIHAWYVAIFSY